MALYDRLLHFSEPRIPGHPFVAAMGELLRGQITVGDLASVFNLDASEQIEAATLLGKMQEAPESWPLGAFVNLANVGTSYDAIAGSRGLGFVAVDVNGITRLELRVRYNKIGTGTLDWQLWNETDGAQVGITSDSVAGDNKTAVIIVTPASPLSGGVKLLRPRVKSSVSTDDPVYYGSCLIVRRAARMTPEDFHEIVCWGQWRKVAHPLDTVAKVKTRLGV